MTLRLLDFAAVLMRYPPVSLVAGGSDGDGDVDGGPVGPDADGRDAGPGDAAAPTVVIDAS